MNAKYSRKGSALLIVLGMLAFMVVSAVSFSAYMRSSRLPSSYLRRTAASRQLVKAALAEAIERLDVAIGENPYPDQRVDPSEVNRPSTTRLDRLGEVGSEYRNFWFHKIFIGGRSFLSPDDTVSTLTLEGLAYIPPPLVNEARRYSRMSKAATWHPMSFDAGRYAYCAIDVSDYFDVNRMVANGRRNSATRRITLAHLFENANHNDYESALSGWESFMSSYRENISEEDEATSGGRITKSKMPLISMADWNLAVNDRQPSGVVSPFCKYVNGGSNFYGLNSNTGAQADRFRAMQFVTDSYLPGRELDKDTEADLSVTDGQPFDGFDSNTQASMLQVLQRLNADETDGMKLCEKKLSRLDMFCLYDYLDGDDVPVSLALPTVERVPMVCGIKPTVSINLKTVEDDSDPGVVTDGFIEKTINYMIDSQAFIPGFMGGKIEATVAFPFKRGEEIPHNYTYDASLRLFFAPAGVSLRGTLATKIKPVTTANGEDFKKTAYENGVFKIYATAMGAAQFNSVATEQDAVKQVSLNLTSATQLSSVLSEPAFWVKLRYKADKNGQPVEGTEELIAAHCNIVPLDANGNPDSKYSTDAAFAETLKSGAASELVLYLAPYVRVKSANSDTSGKVVDMAPAYADDDLYNGLNNESALGPSVPIYFGTKSPMLRFTTETTGGEPIVFSPEGFKALSSGGALEIKPKALMCPDPRYNHAPENWVSADAATPAAWLGAFGEKGSDTNCSGKRDGDIFMFVSNQEYMQSVYELAFLPRTGNLNSGSGASSTSGQYKVPQNGTLDYPTEIADCLNGQLMWRTYRCFDNADGDRDPFEDIGLVRNDGAFRVNPCSPSLDAIMAAFANTPYDWWAASTNNIDISTSSFDSAKDFNKKYAFSEMNTGNANAKFAWDDLEAVAKKFMEKVRGASGDWEAALDNLEWDNGDMSMFCGVPLEDTDTLHSVDRKYLYGFWHDSFANRQQLFLVFVRAEPLMMGGGSARQVPPQLGARAVALVWRDPKIEGEDLRTSEADKTVPHRTRVLFYRQFE